MKVISGSEVEAHLRLDICRGVVREAMVALSNGEALQSLREIIRVPNSQGLFGVMPGALDHVFGAKLASVFPPAIPGGPSHQGILAIFDREAGGSPICIMPAGPITRLRTAAASAAATDALARPDSSRLCVLGTGEQAWAHLEAIIAVRPIDRITVWGRAPAKAQALAIRAGKFLGVATFAEATVEKAICGADIICTTTAASEPILYGSIVAQGTHINVVGSSWAGPAEIDNELVAASRYFVDHRPSAIQQSSDFLRAKAAGLVDDPHILAEIGEVFSGQAQGRASPLDITIYKSLGSIVQDLAVGWHVFNQSLIDGFGTETDF